MIDPSIKGQELDSVSFPIDRSKLVELARAFHDDDATWYDLAAASDAGFSELPVPPTVSALVDHWRPGGALSTATAIGADLARILHGEASWEYHAPVRVGDELTATSSVSDVVTREGKRGGTMTMVMIETRFTRTDGTLVVVRNDTLIETGAPA